MFRRILKFKTVFYFRWKKYFFIKFWIREIRNDLKAFYFYNIYSNSKFFNDSR